MNRNPYSYERIITGGEIEPRFQPTAFPPQYQAPSTKTTPYMTPGDVRQLKVVRCPDASFTHTNLFVVSSSDFSPETKYVRINDKFIFNIKPISGLPPGHIGPTRIQRTWAQFSLNQEVLAEAMDDPATQSGSSVHLVNMDVEVSFLSSNQETRLNVDSDEVSALMRSNFNGQIFSLDQQFVFDFRGNNFKGVVTKLAVVPLDVLRDNKHDTESNGGSNSQAEFGILSNLTVINLSKAQGSLIELKGSAARRKANAIIQPDFKFEDMGIGGLDKEFSNIFRRAFASRIFPPDLVDKLGIQHVKGILLYGPPGTGKTLMARQIGKMLNAVEPLIVSGPEILNKYVGQSEENIRKLFEPAEKEYKEKGDESQLHIIIFDELDAICKQRGSKNDGTGVGDSVVNQLLSKMDGVDQLNNILIIGMTNRKELIDDALLRPGRLEVQIEVGLPDESGRFQIIKIHTAKIRENKILESDVNLNELAKLTKNYSGAEIAGLVKSASSFAFNRHIKVGSMAQLNENISDMKIQWDDFLNALDEVKPAFGIASEEFDQCAMNGVIEFEPSVRKLMDDIRLFVEQVHQSARSPLLSVLLHGPSGSGKTALAATIAKQSSYPFVKLVSPENMIGFTESQKINAISKIFNDSYKSPLSLIVIDNIERLLEWVPIGARFSNSVLQVLLVLIKKQPPKDRRLLIIGTTSERRVLEEMDLAPAFSNDVYIPNIRSVESLRSVVESVGLFDEDSSACSSVFSELQERIGDKEIDIGIKKLLLLIETARQDTDKKSRFIFEILSSV